MATPFTLDVEYNGQLLQLPCELQVTGFTYRIATTINNTSVIFEQDEEQQYRAIVSGDAGSTVTSALLQAVAAALEEALR